MTNRSVSTSSQSWRTRLGRTYSLVPDSVDDLLTAGGRIFQRTRPRKTPLVQVCYPDGFRLLVAGRSTLLSYFVLRGGDEPKHITELASVARRRLPAALDHYSAQADLTLAQVERRTGQDRFGPRYLQIPGGVGSSLATPSDLEAYYRTRCRHARNIQVARKSGLAWRFSQKKSDFDDWYHDFYVPTVNHRFGELGLVRSYPRLHRLFRRGGILWIEHEGRHCAGDLVRIGEGVLFFIASGEKHVESANRVKGAGPAGYMAKVEFAQQLGLKTIHLGVSRPSLQDGVLQFKKGWGSRIHEVEPCDYDVLLRWDRFDREVARFLLRTAPIVRGPSGFAGVIVNPENADFGASAPQLAATRRLAVPGLQSLVMLSSDPAASRSWSSDQPDSISRAILADATSQDVASWLGRSR